MFEKLLNHPDIKVSSASQKKIPYTGYFFAFTPESSPQNSIITGIALLILILKLKA